MKNGFTLIELLIVSTIIGILLTTGVASYNNFNRKRMVREAALELMNNLRYAQSKALSGEKPTGCTDVLDGWKLEFTSSRDYRILPVCSGAPLESAKITYSFSHDKISKTSGPNSFLFKVLAQGVNYGGEIELSGFGYQYKIKVTESGEISDEGF